MAFLVLENRMYAPVTYLHNTVFGKKQKGNPPQKISIVITFFIKETKGPSQVLLFLNFLRIVKGSEVSHKYSVVLLNWESKKCPQTCVSGGKEVHKFYGTSLRSDFPKRQSMDEKQIDFLQFL